MNFQNLYKVNWISKIMYKIIILYIKYNARLIIIKLDKKMKDNKYQY